MARRLSPDDLVLDVGANVGNHTMFLALAAKCNVIAFEPDEHLATAILQSANLNRASDRITVLRKAVGAHPGRGRLILPDSSNLGSQRVVVDAIPGSVEVITLDSLSFARPVRAIKIDVEGMELDVLKGATRLLHAQHPLLYVESMTEADYDAVQDWLAPHGYCYWQTFNATPTNLFVHAESVVEPEQLRRLLSRSAKEIYRHTARVESLQTSLNAANAKYRAATVPTPRPGHANAPSSRATPSSSDAREDESNSIPSQYADPAEGDLSIGELAPDPMLMPTSECDRRLAARQAAFLEARDRDLQLRRSVARQARRSLSLAKQRRMELIELRGALREARSKVGERPNAADIARMETKFDDLNDKLMSEQDAWRSERRRLLSDLSRVSDALIEAQSAFRDQAAEAVEIRHLASSAEHSRSKAQSDLTALESELERRNERTDHLEALALQFEDQVASLNVQLATERRASEDLAEKVSREHANMDALSKRLNHTQNELALEQANSAKLGEELASEREKIATLRESVTYRLGLQLRQVVLHPTSLFTLPYSLYSLYRRHRAQRAQRALSQAVPHRLAIRAAVDDGEPSERKGIPSQNMVPIEARRLRVAGILDEFSHADFSPECDFTQLSPEAWEHQLGTCQPDFLLIESAWRGKDGCWWNTVQQCGPEIRGIIAWCRERSIPTAFWNKEDPAHFSTFLNVASLVDHVFTTDLDCVPRYKSRLAHEKVSFLPFAAQPRRHHPIVEDAPEDGVCFAGAYYVGYPERCRDFEELALSVASVMPLTIYDRMLGTEDSNYQYPARFQQYIAGTLSPEEIRIAYKGYRYGLNLNSIKQSPSMFARRVFELMASNSVVVSNYSRGLRLMFGDLVISTDNGPEAVARMRALRKTPLGEERRRNQALRKVLSEHTYAARLASLAEALGIVNKSGWETSTAIFGLAQTEAEYARHLDNFYRQTASNLTLHVFKPASIETWLDSGMDDRISLHVLEDCRDLSMPSVSQSEYFAIFSPDDFYGAGYLTDLLLAYKYSDVDVTGKSRRFTAQHGSSPELIEGTCYKRTHDLAYRRSVLNRSVADKTTVGSALANNCSEMIAVGNQLAVDPFNYCEGGSDLEESSLKSVVDLPTDDGMSLRSLQSAGSRAAVRKGHEPHTIDLEAIAGWFPSATKAGIETGYVDGAFEVRSSMGHDERTYIYSAHRPSLTDWGFEDEGALYAEASPGLDIQVALIFFDASGERLEHRMLYPNRNNTFTIPALASRFTVGIRVRGGGLTHITRLVPAAFHELTAGVPTSAPLLVVTNIYPDYHDLYRNQFVHTRAREYLRAGKKTEVFRVVDRPSPHYREFRGVDVIEASTAHLEECLRGGPVEFTYVHFLTPEVWQVIARNSQRLRGAAIWIHGSDIQAWWRRATPQQTSEELGRAQEASAARLAFWRTVFKEAPANVSFVFVSDYLAKTALEDLEISPSEVNYYVIHNPIDTDAFDYEEKSSDQRKSILSIRPYTSDVYGNDLSVRAVLELSRRPFFEELNFTFVGDGPLFESTTEPIAHFENVRLVKRFVTRDEIRQLHKSHGVMLIPSRMDTHGVSRDEAMSSGLVPIASRVGAVPEFVDSDCGFLCDAENHHQLAEAIGILYREPSVFLAKSARAALRVRSQSPKSRIVQREMDLSQVPQSNGHLDRHDHMTLGQEVTD